MLDINITGIKPIIQFSGKGATDLCISDTGKLLEFNEAIAEKFPKKYQFVEFDGNQFFNINMNNELVKNVGEWNGKIIKSKNKLEVCASIICEIFSVYEFQSPICILVDFIMLELCYTKEEIEGFFATIYRGARNIKNTNEYVNTVVIIMKNNCSPLKEDHLVHSEFVPLPDQQQRSRYLKNFTQNWSERLVAVTEGMALKDLQNILRFSARSGFEDDCKAAESYIFKMTRNPYLEARERFDSWKTIFNELSKEVIGQDESLSKISKLLYRRIHNNNHRPLVLFLCGATGVGKTETAKAISKLIFGSEKNLYRYDMSAYSSHESVWSLVGSPNGYVGHDDGVLSNNIVERPFSVHLFDEIEKADKNIIEKLFLSIMDSGKLEGFTEETLNFENAILIFTSNLGFSLTDEISSDDEENKKRVIMKLMESFAPEFLGRLNINSDISSISVLNRLSDSVTRKIVDKAAKRIERDTANDSSMAVVIDEKARALIAASLNKNTYGGREIESAVDTAVLNAFCHRDTLGDSCVITAAKDKNGKIRLCAGSVLNGDVKQLYIID